MGHSGTGSVLLEASLGYALCFTISATSIWGGVLPFLPLSFQTSQVTITFFLSQSIAFCGTFLIVMTASYSSPQITRKTLIMSSGALIFLGYAALITAMYVELYVIAFVTCSGVMIGIGCAGYLMLWQRYFASQPPERGNLAIIYGTAAAPLIYLVLHLIPIAVTAFIIAFVLVPLCGLCIVLCTRTIDFNLPMFHDIPHEHPRVYRQTVHAFWRSAICVGALGFVSGVVRSIALSNAVVGDVVNVASMVGALASATVLLVLWRRFSFRFDITTAYLVLFPFIITAFLLLPFLGQAYLDIFAGITYMLFSFSVLLMLIQCAQVSRDRGINPLFIFGFFAGVVYLLQSVGFIFGYYSDTIRVIGLQPLAIVALGSVWFLAMVAAFAKSFPLFRRAKDPAPGLTSVEFIALRRTVPTARPQQDAMAQPSDRTHAATDGKTAHTGTLKATDASASQNDGIVIRDRVSKQCNALRIAYGLSTREAEVAELIARGQSVASIAEELVVSENTVRTHSKRIYTKLGIHKRQELMTMLDRY